MKKIRIAILGYGRSGSQLHANPIQKHADLFDLVAVCDTDGARRAEAHERFCCPTYTDYHTMLAEQQLDIVSIVTRSHQHCQMTCDVLAAGVDVLVTKPWAVNTHEALRMVAAQQATGHTIYPWLPARWGSDVRRVQRLVDEQTIGDIFLIRRAVCSFGTRCDWQTESRYGGGYLLNWGAHIIDPPVHVLGSPVTSLYARLKQTINPGDVEDTFLAIMNLANGTIVQAEYTIATEKLPGWFIQGTLGTAVINGNELLIHAKTPAQPADPTKFSTMQTDSKPIREEITGSPWGDQNEIYADLAAAIHGQRPFPVSSATALEISRLMDAMRQADRQNQVVPIPR